MYIGATMSNYRTQIVFNHTEDFCESNLITFTTILKDSSARVLFCLIFNRINFHSDCGRRIEQQYSVLGHKDNRTAKNSFFRYEYFWVFLGVAEIIINNLLCKQISSCLIKISIPSTSEMYPW